MSKYIRYMIHISDFTYLSYRSLPEHLISTNGHVFSPYIGSVGVRITRALVVNPQGNVTRVILLPSVPYRSSNVRHGLSDRTRGCSSVVEQSLGKWKAPGSSPGVSETVIFGETVSLTGVYQLCMVRHDA